MHFLHIRPMDETVLKEVIPDAWWPGKSAANSSSATAYESTCQTIQDRVTGSMILYLFDHFMGSNFLGRSVLKLIYIWLTDVEDLQVRFIKNLLTNSDGTEKRPSSRALFLRKFRQFIRDVVRVSTSMVLKHLI